MRYYVSNYHENKIDSKDVFLSKLVESLASNKTSDMGYNIISPYLLYIHNKEYFTYSSILEYESNGLEKYFEYNIVEDISIKGEINLNILVEIMNKRDNVLVLILGNNIRVMEVDNVQTNNLKRLYNL